MLTSSEESRRPVDEACTHSYSRPASSWKVPLEEQGMNAFGPTEESIPFGKPSSCPHFPVDETAYETSCDSLPHLISAESQSSSSSGEETSAPDGDTPGASESPRGTSLCIQRSKGPANSDTGCEGETEGVLVPVMPKSKDKETALVHFPLSVPHMIRHVDNACEGASASGMEHHEDHDVSMTSPDSIPDAQRRSGTAQATEGLVSDSLAAPSLGFGALCISRPAGRGVKGSQKRKIDSLGWCGEQGIKSREADAAVDLQRELEGEKEVVEQDMMDSTVDGMVDVPLDDVDCRQAATQSDASGTEARGHASGQDSEKNSVDQAQPIISRRDLLDIIRKHSCQLLTPEGQKPQGQGSFQEPPGLQMDHQYWQLLLDLYFVVEPGRSKNKQSLNNRVEGVPQDLLFFVRKPTQRGKQLHCSSGSNLEVSSTSPVYENPTVSSSLVFQSSQHELEQQASLTAHERRPTCFARTWAPALSDIIGDRLEELDWRRSFYLNLICHSHFTLTLAVCSRQALEKHRKNKGAQVPPIYKVTRRVIASPSYAVLDSEGGGPPRNETDKGSSRSASGGFPNISFALDSHDDALVPAILENPDHCLCVLLNVHGGAAYPSDEAQSAASDDQDGTKSPTSPTSPRSPRSPYSPRSPHSPTSPSRFGLTSRSPSYFGRSLSPDVVAIGDPLLGVGPKATLFSGFVSYAMLKASVSQGPNSSGSSWLHSTGAGATGPSATAPPQTLIMRGPGGKGQATVAITPVIKRALPPLPPKPPTAHSFKVPRPRPPKQQLPNLEELQARLVTAQQELLALVQEQAEEAAEGERPNTGGMVGVNSAAARRLREERSKMRLKQLQEELGQVQSQLQQLQHRTKNQNHVPGNPNTPVSKSLRGNEPGADQASRSFLGFKERAAKTPPRRTMLHDDSERLEAEKNAQKDLPLKCCLQSLSLPWEHLAFDLLFKEMPVKVHIGGQIFPPPRSSGSVAGERLKR